MTKYYLQNSIYMLLLVVLIISSCNSQVNTNSSHETANNSKPIPKIIGTPPPTIFNAGSINDSNLVSQYIRTIFQDSKGNFWFGPAGQSVVRYDVNTLKYFSKAEFFEGNSKVNSDPKEYGFSVHAIAEDKNGNIWFGTDHGAVKYDGKNFNSYTEKSGLSNIQIGRKCILSDRSGTIWIGTSGGAFRYNANADTIGGKCFSLFELIPAIKINDIFEDNDGNIWFASQDKGIFRFDPANTDEKTESIKIITGKEGLGENYAGGIAQDRSGNLWFTTKSGICRYDGKNLTYLTSVGGLGEGEVWGIFMERSGIIWITARGSTTRYDPSIDISNPEAFTIFTEKDGINCCVQSMYQDRSGNMWWGAGSGLYRFDGKRFYQVKQNGPW